MIPVFRFEDRRVAKWWRLTNLLDWTRQLGALPAGPRSFARIVVRQLRWMLLWGW